MFCAACFQSVICGPVDDALMCGTKDYALLNDGEKACCTHDVGSVPSDDLTNTTAAQLFIYVAVQSTTHQVPVRLRLLKQLLLVP